MLTAADVRALLPMGECIDVMADAFHALADGRATVPNRTSLPVHSLAGTLLLMPATMRGVAKGADTPGNGAWFGAKVLSIAPENHSTGRASHQGVIVLFEGSHGSPVAVIDAGAITAIRTAAVSAVATRLLARSDASRLAIIGAGVQAYSHLTAMAAVRSLREVRVWSRDSGRCRALVRSAEVELGIHVRMGAGARDAVEGADVVCTATSASTPVVQSSWISPGTHLNAIGAHRPTERELDSETVRRARVFVDHTPAAMAEAGDILIPIAESCIDGAHVLGDLPQLLCRSVSARLTDDDVTVFKSVGIAIEDIAAAAQVYRRAVAAGVGIAVELA
jgi:ornithine cyclodeaminase